MTLPEIAEYFALRRAIQTNSLHQYHAAIACLGRYLGRLAIVQDLSDETINGWLSSLENRLAPATQRNRRQHVLALWRTAVKIGVSVPPGEIRRVRVPPRPPRAWTVAEVRRILATANGYPTVELIVRVGWDTGARWGDCVSLKTCDLSSDGIICFVQRKTGRLHVSRLHKSTMRALLRSGHTEREHVCPWAYSDEHWRAMFGRVVAKAGLSGTFKWMRRSSGTNVERRYPGAGAAHLGHGKSIAVDHYFDARILAAGRPMPEEL